MRSSELFQFLRDLLTELRIRARYERDFLSMFAFLVVLLVASILFLRCAILQCSSLPILSLMFSAVVLFASILTQLMAGGGHYLSETRYSKLFRQGNLVIWSLPVGLFLGTGLYFLFSLLLDLMLSDSFFSLFSLLILPPVAILLLMGKKILHTMRIFDSIPLTDVPEELKSVIKEVSEEIKVEIPLIKVENSSIRDISVSVCKKGFLIRLPLDLLRLRREEVKAVIAQELVHLKLDAEARTVEFLKPELLKLSIYSFLFNLFPLIGILLFHLTEDVSILVNLDLEFLAVSLSLFLLILSIAIGLEPDVRTLPFREVRADFIASLVAGGKWMREALSKIYEVKEFKYTGRRLKDISSPEISLKDLIFPSMKRHPEVNDRAFITHLADALLTEGLRVSKALDYRLLLKILLRAFPTDMLHMATKAAELVKRGIISISDLRETGFKLEEIFSLLVVLDLENLLEAEKSF
jgi:hypothetical protein